MNAIYPQQRLPVRAMTLLGIVVLHLLLYGLVFQRPAGSSKAAPEQRALLLWQLPVRAPPVVMPEVRVPPAPPVREKAVPRQRAPAEQPPPTRTPLPVAAALPAPDLPLPPVAPPAVTSTATPPANPAPSASRTIPDNLQGYLPGSTRRELARIASELRKESRFPADFNVHAKPDKLAQGIADAYRGDGPVTITDIKLPDGRVMTKVSGPLGSMCIYKDSVGHTGGRDQIQGGVPTKTTTCPQ